MRHLLCRAAFNFQIRRDLNKKPLLRGWWWYEDAAKQPANGEYDFNTGQGDYFFGKPYFVHQKAKTIFYEQVDWIYSGKNQREDLINLDQSRRLIKFQTLILHV